MQLCSMLASNHSHFYRSPGLSNSGGTFVTSVPVIKTEMEDFDYESEVKSEPNIKVSDEVLKKNFISFNHNFHCKALKLIRFDFISNREKRKMMRRMTKSSWI